MYFFFPIEFKIYLFLFRFSILFDLITVIKSIKDFLKLQIILLLLDLGYNFLDTAARIIDCLKQYVLLIVAKIIKKLKNIIKKHKKSLESTFYLFPRHYKTKVILIVLILFLQIIIRNIAFETLYGQDLKILQVLLYLKDMYAEIGAYDARLIFMCKRIRYLDKKKKKIILLIYYRNLIRQVIKQIIRTLKIKDAKINVSLIKLIEHLVVFLQQQYPFFLLIYASKKLIAKYIMTYKAQICKQSSL